MQRITRVALLGVSLAGAQLFDIAIHAATDQLEPIRVSSNLVILVWLLMAAFGKINRRSMPAAVSSVGAYLVLNAVFLVQEGMTNQNQGGELRILLFLLIALTVALSTVMTILSPRTPQGQNKVQDNTRKT